MLIFNFFLRFFFTILYTPAAPAQPTGSPGAARRDAQLDLGGRVLAGERRPRLHRRRPPPPQPHRELARAAVLPVEAVVVVEPLDDAAADA